MGTIQYLSDTFARNGYVLYLCRIVYDKIFNK